MFYTIQSIAPICINLHQQAKTIVLATGFFDLLHEEHIKFLKKAVDVGDVLIVAVESDLRAKKIKGKGRPHDTQSVRCQKLLDLGYVDYVIALPDDFDHYEAFDSLMSAVRPSVYAISSHTDHQENKASLAKKYGGHLQIVHDWNPNISTSKIIQQNKV